MEDTPKEDSSNRERIWEKVQIKVCGIQEEEEMRLTP